ncbi:MAG: hypothetical protein GC179_11605 [Anaerolineaceae bacterium]|nr:hypothetical protein [Anaerolineaceae bacterium]
MDAWQPPLDSKTWINDINIYRTKPLLNLTYEELLDSTEASLFPVLNGGLIDEQANGIETWIRKKLRTWSGGDLSEFIINPNIITGRSRTDAYLQAINRVICGDQSIKIYLRNLAELPAVEQILWIILLLEKHPQMTKLHYARKSQINTAALIDRIGLDKFGIC